MRLTLTLALSLLIVLPAAGQTDGVDLGDPLTSEVASDFVGALEDILAIYEEHGRRGRGVGWFDAMDPDTDLEAVINAHPARREIMGVLQQHNFESPEQWAQASRRFANAYAVLKLGGSDRTVTQQVQTAIDMIEANPSMSAEQKAEAIEGLREQEQSFGASMPEAPEGDQRAVAGVMDEFEGLVLRSKTAVEN